MQPFTASQIRGIYATLLLPLRDDDSIEFDLLAHQLNSYVTAGVDGIYSNGTAGEFYAQTEAEFAQISRLLADACTVSGVPYQIGAAWPTPHDALRRIALAADFAPSAIQVTLPDWWPPSLEECIAFLRSAAEAAGDVPLVLYNPPHAKRVLTASELGSVLDRVPQVVGLKTAAGDEAWYHSMLSVIPRISVFVPGHTLATGVQHGAAGSYSNVACLQPRGAVRWYRLMESDPAKADRIQADIQQFLQQWIVPFRDRDGYSNMALDKLLAWLGGWTTMPLRLRWPYRGLDSKCVAELRARCRDEIPFLFEV